MSGNLIESNIVLYKKKIIEIINNSQIFDKTAFIDGNFFSYTKMNLNNSNSNKATCLLAITGGDLSPLSGSNSNVSGLFSDISLMFVIIAKNNTNVINSIEKESNDVFLTSLHNLVKILYNSKELKDLSTNQISFSNYSFQHSEELSKNNLNMMTINATHRILFLKNK